MIPNLEATFNNGDKKLRRHEIEEAPVAIFGTTLHTETANLLLLDRF
jgi:hypothetical protein